MSDKDETGSMGRLMVVLAWIAFIGLLTVGAQKLMDRQHNPNESVDGSVDASGVRQVVLKANRAGHYVATGGINGQPVVFLVDTGATDVAMSLDLAKKLGIPRLYETRMNTANGSVTGWSTVIDEVSLGPLVLRQVEASILPNMDDDVLLGMSFLERMELIQRNGVLTVRQYGG